MKIKDYKCKCGHNDFFFADKESQKGIYCSYCGKWLKWADKDERNLRMKQMSILDKIRAEIKDNRDDWIKGQDPEWHAYDRCLYIIDKYKAESEEK